MTPIALAIGGTKLRRAGFAPLVSVGVLPPSVRENMDRTTIVSEKPVYVLKHTEDYILYMLVDKEVKPADVDSKGVLSIALTIAKGQELADEVSPYTVLKAVYDKFREQYMTTSPDGRDSFIDTDINAEDFERILFPYKTVESNRAFRIMNDRGQTGTLRVPDFKMEDFFRNTQYPEFMNFKDIEIGQNCETTRGLDKLIIPLPVVKKEEPKPEPGSNKGSGLVKTGPVVIGTTSGTTGIGKKLEVTVQKRQYEERKDDGKKPQRRDGKHMLAILAFAAVVVLMVVIYFLVRNCGGENKYDDNPTPKVKPGGGVPDNTDSEAGAGLGKDEETSGNDGGDDSGTTKDPTQQQEQEKIEETTDATEGSNDTDDDALRMAEQSKARRKAEEARRKAEEEKEKNKPSTPQKPVNPSTPSPVKSGFNINNAKTQPQKIAREMVQNPAGYFKLHSITNDADKQAIARIIQKYLPHDSWEKLEQMRKEVENYMSQHGLK